MKNIKSNYEKWLYIIPFVLLWLILVQISGIQIISLETIKKIPNAVFYTGIFYFLFSKYIWKWRFLQRWLVPYPNLQGTWSGTLQSTWEDPKTKKLLDPFPVKLCIRQDFENIFITMYTKESPSYSRAARFLTEPDGTTSLSYTYSNKPSAIVRDRSEIHDGAAYLKVSNSSKLSLNGEYWTSRKTTGELKVEKISENLIDCYSQ